MSAPPSVTFLLPDKQTTQLYPGDLIGRGAFSALLLDDPKISEAHALLSLRGASLQLLALRGGLRLDGDRRFRGELSLEAGQRIRLSEKIVLEVQNISTPDRILVLHGLASGPFPLTKPEYHLGGQPLRVDPHDGPIAASVWRSGETWMRRVGAEDHPLLAGESWTVGDVVLVARLQETTAHSTARTESPAKLSPPPADTPRIQIHIQPTVTRIQFPDPEKEDARITHLSAKILHITAEFTQTQGQASWRAISENIWRAYSRGTWDQRKNYLRRKLKEAGIRDTFFVYQGGQVWLDLHGPENVTVDSGARSTNRITEVI